MRRNPKTCYKHRRNYGQDQHELDPILTKLPKYTGGHAGDRCTYCAYLKGREDVLRELEEDEFRLPPSSPLPF